MKLVFLVAGAQIALEAHHNRPMGKLLRKPRRISIHCKTWTPAPKMRWIEGYPRAFMRTGTESRMTKTLIKKLEELRDTLHS